MELEIGGGKEPPHRFLRPGSVMSATMVMPAAAVMRVLWVAAPPLSVSRSDTNNPEYRPLVGRLLYYMYFKYSELIKYYSAAKRYTFFCYCLLAIFTNTNIAILQYK